MKRKGRKKSRIRKIAMGILSSALVLLLTLVLVGIIFYKSGEISLKASANMSAPQIYVDAEEINKIKENLEYKDSVAWQDNWVIYDDKVYEYRENTLNFLLLGIDQGGSLSKETDLSDWSAGQADTIFLVTLNQEDKRLSVIGIPRNSMVDVEVYNSEEECIETIYNQICLQYGYAGGGKLGLEKTKESVSDLMWGLPIHGACAVSFDAVSVITDRLGGIEVVVPDDMTGYNSSYTKGSTQKLVGKNVVNYLRYREYDALGSPTTRLERQKAFMKTAAERVMQEIKINPIFVRDIYESVIPYMNTDITADEAVYIASKSLECTLDEQSFYQLTGEDQAEFFIKENGELDFYDDYYLDEDELKRIMIDVFYKQVQISD